MKKISIIVYLMAACTQPLSNLEIIQNEGAKPMQPPAWYEAEWHRMEACSGLKGDFSAVAWYVSPQIAVRDSSYRGVYLAKNHAIVLLDNAVNVSVIVDHEEMHALLRGADHPAQYFNGACGDLM